MSTTSTQSHVTFIDSEASLLPLLDSIANLPNDPPSLYINLKGVKLGRHGSISILTLHIAPTKKTYLIDIHSPGEVAFSTTINGRTSLKTILESSTIPKVVFDIRDVSHALFNLFQISVNGIRDLQLMELASRTGSRKFVSDLASCIEREIPGSAAAKIGRRVTEVRGRRLFAPEAGGCYEVLNEWPLKPEIIQMCEQDVALLPGLYGVYNAKLRLPPQAFWRVHVRETTKDRIKLSRSAGYDGDSESRDLGWDDHGIERQIESWNDDILTEAMIGTQVLNEHDEWVAAPEDDFDKLSDEDEVLDNSGLDDDWHRDTARDCMGWEEDMMKNGEYF